MFDFLKSKPVAPKTPAPTTDPHIKYATLEIYSDLVELRFDVPENQVPVLLQLLSCYHKETFTVDVKQTIDTLGWPGIYKWFGLTLENINKGVTFPASDALAHIREEIKSENEKREFG